MAKLNFKEIASPALKLFIICLVSAFLLAGTNHLTSKKIEQNLSEQETQTRKVVFSAAAAFGEFGEKEIDDITVSYCAAFDGAGKKIGYVFTCANKGYGGSVSVMTGIDIDGNVVRSAILSMDDETPGLGQNASKEEFIGLFTGKTGPFNWVKSGGTGNDITGVTSATFTSKAVIKCVNDSIKAFNILTGGEA